MPVHSQTFSLACAYHTIKCEPGLTHATDVSGIKTTKKILNLVEQLK